MNKIYGKEIPNIPIDDDKFERPNHNTGMQKEGPPYDINKDEDNCLQATSKGII